MIPTSIALVIPVFQFEKSIHSTLLRLREWQESRAQEFQLRIIFSDDGSMDRTPSIIEDWIRERGDGWHLIRSEINRGKGAAVRRGISEAYRYDPDRIIFSDCDLFYGLEILFERMVPMLDSFDVVVVDRSWKRETFSVSFARTMASVIFGRFVTILTGVIFRDTQGGLKGFRARECRPIFDVLTLNGFAFDVEILSIAHAFRFRVAQIPVMFANPARIHQSTVSVVTASIGMVRDLLRINLNWRFGQYSSPPLRQRIEDHVYRIRDG